jgi:uncharacterized protein involved in exopolysaccharide biosynthesis
LRLLETYHRHRSLYLVPILVMALAAAVFLATLKVDFQSQGVLFVNSQSLLSSLNSLRDNTNMWITPAQVTANEINQLVRTDSFIRAVIQRTDIEKEMSQGQEAVNEIFVAVRKGISVYTLGDNQTLIQARSETPAAAYQLVNSIIDNYIQWKINSKQSESQAAVDFFSGLITQYRSELDGASNALKDYITAHPEPVRGSRPYLEQFEIDRLNGEVKAAQDRYTGALDKEENARLALKQVESDSRQTYNVIDAPEIPLKSTTSLRKLALDLAIFMAAGVFLSTVLVVASSLLDRTVRFPMDVTSQLGLPVLAVIPNVNLKGTPKTSRWTAWLPTRPTALSLPWTRTGDPGAAEAPEE